MAGSGLAAPAPILAAMLVLADELRATRFPLGLTDAVIRSPACYWTGARSRETTSTSDATKFIAGGLWYPPAVAPRGNVYSGIANMYQYSVAVSHPSKRLYVDSAVALDASSGKLRRDFQPVPDDFYDWSPYAAARAGCRVVAKYVATSTDE